MFRFLLASSLFVAVTLALLNEDEDRTPRIFKDRFNEKKVFGDAATQTSSESLNEESKSLADLARVQAEQAKTFQMWSTQFQIFKNNMLKFVEHSTSALQKHDENIKIIERVVKKLAQDINE